MQLWWCNFKPAPTNEHLRVNSHGTVGRLSTNCLNGCIDLTGFGEMLSLDGGMPCLSEEHGGVSDRTGTPFV